MTKGFTVSFRKDISLYEELEEEKIVLQSHDRQLIFKTVKPGLSKTIKTLAKGAATLDQVHDWIQQDGSNYAALSVYGFLQKFSQLGWLCYSVMTEEQQALATSVPISLGVQFRQKAVITETRYQLSRFAYVHSIEGQAVLESPLSKMQIWFHSWQGLAIISELASPKTCEEIKLPKIPLETVEQLISLLLSANMLSEVSKDNLNEEQDNLTLTQWEFHDLLFHSRSRMGRHSNPVGATYRFLDKIEPLPSVKPPMNGDAINLHRPNLEAIALADQSFTQILETRQSFRDYDEQSPVTLEQLGEFLYRCARVKGIEKTEFGELCSRPYPSGGALYELELYPIVRCCQNLASGLYHYDPQAHQLYRLSKYTEIVKKMFEDTTYGLLQPVSAQIVIIISARFQRLAWKYESIAYTLMLKHVGALYQTMYLVATSMGLAPCAIGCGDSDLFAQATGCDYYAETSIGEFVLGSRA